MLTGGSDDAPYYQAGGVSVLECHYTGSPRCNVYWQWQPCKKTGCNSDESKWVDIANSRNVVLESRDTGSKLWMKVKTRETGFYRCVATNTAGAESTLLTDVQELKFVATNLVFKGMCVK